MNAKMTIFLLAVFLAALTPACEMRASLPNSGAGKGLSDPALPVRVLRNAPVEKPALLTDYPPSGWRITPGSKGSIRTPDGELFLSGKPGQPIFGARRAPTNGDLLVHFGNGDYAIHDIDGALVTTVPLVHHLFDDAGLAYWRWKDSRSLVGVTEISPPVRRPMYPDGDILPESTLLFLYEPYDNPEKVYLLSTPEPAVGTVIRLEGVTDDGMLLLGAVEPEQYFGGPPREILGVFELERP